MVRQALLAYSAGIIAATYLSDPAAAFTALLIPWGLSVYLCRRQTRWRPLMCLLVAFGAGMAWHAGWAAHALDRQLPTELEGVDFSVVGVVDSLPRKSDRATVVEFNVLASELGFHPRRVRLSDYQGLALQPGQTWRLKIRLKRPYGLLNLGGFDAEAWLFQQGIAATGYIRMDPGNRLLEERSSSIASIRYRLREQLIHLSAPIPRRDVLLALMLGDRSGLSASNWALFSATGTNHLFVVSGLHIGLIAGLGLAVARAIYLLVPGLGLAVPRQRVGACVALLFALVYAALADFSLPTQRALLMLVACMAGVLLGRPIAASTRLVIGLAGVLSWNPLAAVSLGFWLSFLAVSALLCCPTAARRPLAPSAIARAGHWLRRLSRPQWAVFVALLIPLGYTTQQVPLLAPLINLVAIPVVGLLVLPASLLAAALLLPLPELSGLLLWFAGSVLDLLFDLLNWAHGMWGELSVVSVNIAGASIVFLAAAALLFLAPQALGYRFLSLLICLPLLLPPVNLPGPGEFRLHVLDVGQGLAVILQTRHHALLYDTGPGLDSEQNSGSDVIVPVLRRLGIDHLDKVVVSHGDNDHAGGLPGIVGRVGISEVLSSRSVLAAGIQAQPCRAGNSWAWDGLRFEFLHPQRDSRGNNDDSCVLLIRGPWVRILLPGDIGRSVERELARDWGMQLKVNLLLAPHHGSRTSSSFPFIKMTRPDYVIFAAGYRNGFSHPAPDVVARYQLFGSRTYTTSDSGMISFTSTASGALQAPVQLRAIAGGYWRGGGNP